MKRTYLYLLLIVWGFSNPCNGQIIQTGSLGKSQAVNEGSPRLIKTQGTGDYANVHCGLEDRSGNLWFGTTGEGLYRYDGNSFINFTEKNGLPSNEIWCMYEDNDSNLWFGTGDGVCCYNPSAAMEKDLFFKFRITETSKVSLLSSDLVNDSLAGNAVWSILQDKTGKFLFGTSNGVYRYDGKSITHFLSDSISNVYGLQLKHIQSILEDRNGNIWFASWNQEGACRFDGKSLSSFKPNGDGMVHALLEDRMGNIWFGTRNNGACKFDGKTFTHFADSGSFQNTCIYSMTEDQAGNIWFATETSGAWCYNTSISSTPGVFTNYTVKNGLCHNSVFSIVADRSAKIWFGTRKVSLCNYDGKDFIRFSE